MLFNSSAIKINNAHTHTHIGVRVSLTSVQLREKKKGITCCRSHTRVLHNNTTAFYSSPSRHFSFLTDNLCPHTSGNLKCYHSAFAGILLLLFISLINVFYPVIRARNALIALTTVDSSIRYFIANFNG